MVYDGGQGSCIKVEHLCITNCRKRNFLGFGGGTTAKSEAQTETEHGMMVPMHGGAPLVAESVVGQPPQCSLSSNQVSAPGIRAPLCGSHLSLVVLITGTLTLAVVLPSPDSSHDDE